MTHIYFQIADAAERADTIRRLLSTIDSAAVVLSPAAPHLAAAPQPPNRVGHPVVRLLLGPGADSFNPLDVLEYMPGVDPGYALSLLLEPLSPREVPNLTIGWQTKKISEPVTQILATELLEAVVLNHIQRKKRAARQGVERGPSLVKATNIFFGDDVVYNLAVLLDTEGKVMAPSIYGVIATFLQRQDAWRSAILTLIQGSLFCLNATPVQRAMERTTFDLGMLGSGSGTVYVEAPPGAWRAHAGLARLWLSSLLHLAASRPAGGRPVLFVVDNPAGCGAFPLLRAAQRLPDGAVEVWTGWDDLGQLRAAAGADWSGFVGNCRSVRAVGPQGPVGAGELGAAFGVPAADLVGLPVGAERVLAGDAADAPAPLPVRESAPQSGHVVGFGPARSVGWSGAVAAILGRADRSVVVVESGGGWHARTAGDRAGVGRVVRLDPFGVLGRPDADQFNPLDLLDLEGAGRLDVYEFTELLVQADTQSVDPLWRHWTTNLIRAIFQYLLAVPEKAKTLGELWDTVHSDDVVYNLAVVLDRMGKRLPPDCYQHISVYLQLYDSYRSHILDHVHQATTAYGSELVRRAVERTTFDLGMLGSGSGTVYVEAPPGAWRAHAGLARLWLSSLLHLAASRPAGGRPVLFVVDNPAGCGAFPLLRAAQRLPDGAVEVWTGWDDLGQLRAAAGADWSGFVGNCRSVRAVGPQGPVGAGELGAAFGVPAADLVGLPVGAERVLAGDAADAPAPLPVRESAPQSGHVVGFGPARSVGWSGAVAAILGRADRSVVVVESGGGWHARTAGDRAGVGRVVRLDPFGVLGRPDADQFNPLDLLKVPAPVPFADALYFAEQLWPPGPATLDRFWEFSSLSLAHAVLLYLMSVPDKECSFVELKNILSSDDVVYNLAVVLDTQKKVLPPECYKLIAAFLQRADNERSTILTDTFQALRIFGDPRVAEVTAKSSFPVSEFALAGPMTIYVELPVTRMASYMLLPQLWLGALSRLCEKVRPRERPLFVVDSPLAAQLFPILNPAQSGTVVDLWTAWESVDQIRTRFPADWSAFLGNARTVEAIGPISPVVATELATLFGRPVQSLVSLGEGQRSVLYNYPSSIPPA